MQILRVSLKRLLNDIDKVVLTVPNRLINIPFSLNKVHKEKEYLIKVKIFLRFFLHKVTLALSLAWSALMTLWNTNGGI